MNFAKYLPCHLKHAAHIVIGLQDDMRMVQIFFLTMDTANKIVGKIGRLRCRFSDQA